MKKIEKSTIALHVQKKKKNYFGPLRSNFLAPSLHMLTPFSHSSVSVSVPSTANSTPTSCKSEKKEIECSKQTQAPIITHFGYI
jgi:hypothetical protein